MDRIGLELISILFVLFSLQRPASMIRPAI
jgi:hypothetical protein